MKPPVAAFLSSFTLLASATFSQIPGFHRHDGFYLSMNVGPGFGPIDLKATNALFQKVETSGPGAAVDLKIGFAAVENLIFSFDILSRVISGPDMKVDGLSASSSDNITAADNSYGLGITYYFMPANLFLSGTVGTGKFTMENKDANFKSESEWGPAFQLKLGKEWWVSNNWGLGVSAGFGRVAADDQSDSSNPAYKGELSTGKFFVLFNTTFN